MLCCASLCWAMPQTSFAQGLNPAAAWPPHPSRDHIPEGSKLGSRSPCLGDSLCPEHSGRDQGVLRLTERDNTADMMVMAESQGLATVSLCLPLHGPRGHLGQCPGGSQTKAKGGRRWCGDIRDSHANHHHPPKPNRTHTNSVW